MNILVAFNEEYAMATKVMLKSLIENNHTELSIYVLYIELSDKTITKLSELKNDRVSVNFIKIDEEVLEGVPVPRHFSKEAYIRLFAHSYLDTCIDRILWLDGDMIINDSIEDYYNQDFDNKLFIAVEDVESGHSVEKHKALQMPDDVTYINSGVLLMDLKRIREKIDNQTIKNWIQENYDAIEFVDQDVFNGLMYNEFKVVDPEHLYNYFTIYITPQNKKYVYKNAHILHYAGKCKPWKPGYRYYGFTIWWKYAIAADVENEDLYKKIRISCLKGKLEHRVADFLRMKMPHVYKIAEKRYNVKV